MDFSRRLSLTTNAEETEDGVQWGAGHSASSRKHNIGRFRHEAYLLVLTGAGATIY